MNKIEWPSREEEEQIKINIQQVLKRGNDVKITIDKNNRVVFHEMSMSRIKYGKA